MSSRQCKAGLVVCVLPSNVFNTQAHANLAKALLSMVAPRRDVVALGQLSVHIVCVCASVIVLKRLELSGIMAVLIHQPFVLVIAGGIFVLEALSVIVQTGWYKWTRLRTGTGQRVFLMAPLHHHFQKKDWHENQVVMRFYILGILFAVLALATLKLR